MTHDVTYVVSVYQPPAPKLPILVVVYRPAEHSAVATPFHDEEDALAYARQLSAELNESAA